MDGPFTIIVAFIIGMLLAIVFVWIPWEISDRKRKAEFRKRFPQFYKDE
jgi:hypothetical protein